MNFPATSTRSSRLRQRVLCVVLMGGMTLAVQAGWLGRDFKPANVFAYPARLSSDLQRVAVLPLACGSTADNLPAGCETLEPVLRAQLAKTRMFETVAVDREKLRAATGRAAWTGTETLPPDFLKSLRREYGCDGVLFSEVTVFHAYAPMAIGWRLKLVDARSGMILWAADEVFDASQPAVARAAKNFYKSSSLFDFSREKSWEMMHSPSRFGGYAVAALLATLPPR